MAYPSGPYQSRLFNAINRQRIRWGDRLGRGLRSAQVAAVWAVQILVYPLYLLTQLGRDLTLRLEAAVTQAEPPSLEPPDCDGPLRRTLATLDDFIEHLPLPVAVISHGLPSVIMANQESHPTVRGLACDLTDQSLLLTTEDNDSLAVLSPAQQHSLTQYIRLELADYAYQNYRRKIQSYQYLIPARLGEDPQIWPLWRRFWQLMRWVQQSPVATTTNLFGEAGFGPPLLPVVAPVNLPPLPLPVAICEQLDQSAVRLEVRQDQIQRQWLAWVARVSDRPAFPGTAQALLQKAIAYFFGIEGPQTLPAAEPPTIKQPWLHWEELPALTSGLIATVPRRRSLVDLDADMAIELYALNPPPAPVAPLMKSPDPPPTLNRSPAQTPDHQQDWLDVEAQPTGYERHWLEILLNGFDQIMAKVERGAIAFWRWLIRGWR